MGGNQSTPSSPNPNPATSTMPSPNTPATHDSKPQSEPTHEPKPPESEGGIPEPSVPQPLEKPPENSEIKEDGAVPEGAVEEGGEEEEGECGFCLFMKAGGCREEFIAWEKCVEEGDEKNEDIAEKCFELTAILRKCMEAHPDHYGPLLEAEKAAHEQARKEFEEEKEREALRGAKESATVAEVSDKGGVLTVSEQKSEARDSVLSPSEQEKRQDAS